MAQLVVKTLNYFKSVGKVVGNLFVFRLIVMFQFTLMFELYPKLVFFL